MFGSANLRRVCSTTLLLTRRKYCSKSKDEIRLQRNIGIMAHVDAGKTTTTERLLFYSGEISTKGEVHHGNTVTDYMDQERNRGISIVSAFVKFKWKNHVLNLVDTPGHIDFTAEVENALGVIDGAILLVDSSAGVEAQTTTVWNQINYHELPCLVYINKMDRKDSNVEMCLESLKEKLHCRPICLQMPVLEGGRFAGVVDLPHMERLTWDVGSKSKIFESCKVDKNDELYLEILEKRNELVDELSSIDDDLANNILEIGSLESITASELVRAIRKATLARKVVPVVCGSSYKDVGVQPLLDAIVEYLPSPWDTRLSPNVLSKTDQLMRSFKVEHDRVRGAVTFVRVYSGEVSKGQRLFNASKDKTEVVGKILVPFADDFEEVTSASAGSYAAVTGLKDTHPGEILCSSASALKRIKSQLKTSLSLEDSTVDKLLAFTNRKHHPVFFCSIEASSQAYQQALDKALAELKREDSSLGVTYDEETGQTVLSGMGELHLEIIRDRLRSHYKLDVDTGTVQILYKEKIVESGKTEHILANAIGGQQYEILIRMSLGPDEKETGKLMKIDRSMDSAANLAHVKEKHLTAIERGVQSALSRGKLMGYQVIESTATLHWLEYKRHTPEQLLSAAAAQCVGKLLQQLRTILLEPIMSVEITVPEERASVVVADLGRRRASILDVEGRGDTRVIKCTVPSAEIIGYSTTLRTITSGTASLYMEFHDYRPLPEILVEEMKNQGFQFKY